MKRWIHCSTDQKDFLGSNDINFLRQSAQSNDWRIRGLVAANENAPYDVLKKLSVDPDIDVRISVASNKSTPDDILNSLLNDPEEFIRECALETLNRQDNSTSSRQDNSTSVSADSTNIKDLFINNYVCDTVMEYINDSDVMWEYDNPEDFSNACLDWVYNNLDRVSEMCGVAVTEEDVDSISDWILDECSQGDFDI